MFVVKSNFYIAWFLLQINIWFAVGVEAQQQQQQQGANEKNNGSGCSGLTEKDQAVGTECYTNGFLVECSDSFPQGTFLEFKCQPSYIPSLRYNASFIISGLENEIHSTLCLENNEWDTLFRRLYCEREAKPSNWYCSSEWSDFFKSYESSHSTVMMVIYIIGFNTNLINIVVLTRKSMRNPLNTILTALAVTDFLFILNGLVAEILRLYRKNPDITSSYQLTVERLINNIAYYLFHTWSIYLTLLVAVWRFVGVWYPLKSLRWCVAKKAKWGISAMILFGTILLIIIYGPNSRIKNENMGEPDAPYYLLDQSKVGQLILFWTYAIFVKLIPCSLLAFFTIGLIWGLMNVKKNRSNLMELPGQGDQERRKSNNPNLQDANESKKIKLEFDRTTRILLTILIIFLLTEIPDGIVSILYVSTSTRFSKECLVPTVKFCLFLEQISCVSSFFVYISMGQAYRLTFLKCFNIQNVIKAFARPTSLANTP